MKESTSKSSMGKRSFVSSLLLTATALINSANAKDFLEGNGRFNSQAQIDAWTKVTAQSYDYSIVGNDYMKVQKLETAEVEGFFDDGLYYWLNADKSASKPLHMVAEVLTTNNQIEVCDLRLTTLAPLSSGDATADDDLDNGTTNPEDFGVNAGQSGPPVTSSPQGPAGYERVKNKDVLFFRLGYYNYMKVNTESLIHKTTNNQWLKIDILIHWEEQLVSVYVDGKPTPIEAPRAQPFFVERKSKAENANALGIYNLTPGGICHIKNVQVCDDMCAGKDPSIVQLAGAHMLIGSIAVASAAAISTLLF